MINAYFCMSLSSFPSVGDSMYHAVAKCFIGGDEPAACVIIDAIA